MSRIRKAKLKSGAAELLITIKTVGLHSPQSHCTYSPPSQIPVEMFVIFCLYSSSIDLVFEILSKKCQQRD